ncbi:MAG: sucrose phosphorylase [Clostridia bacterium]|nr:sucrose phosphorylase [Clostridia bacterium]
MEIQNKVMLITYADSLGKDLKELRDILNTYFREAIHGVHILPFFPSSADRGFAPMTYQEVDPSFGNWEDVKSISKNHFMMYDFMVNHISRSSSYFQDFLKNKNESPFAELFLRYKDFWPGGDPSQADIDLIYKRKPRAPYIEAEFEDGSSERVWCTFDEEQIDLNPNSEVTRRFFKENLTYLAQNGASLIRLDAFAYATKRVGTNCFFVEPDIWELLEYIQSILRPYHVEVLPEIHEHYTIQQKLERKGYWVYDFALPMLVLHALYSGDSVPLANWIRICPRKQFTTLDTHDGIGVVDVYDLLSQEDIEKTKEYLYSRGANVKHVYNTTAYNNLDIYQINCTYYSALGDNDDAYLLARAIQFFAPGIPQVYYVGLLAGSNDLELLESTKVGRNINRHYYTREEVELNTKRPIVKRLIKLMQFRNECQSFDNEIQVTNDGSKMTIIRTGKNGSKAILNADLKSHAFTIEYTDRDGALKQLDLAI